MNNKFKNIIIGVLSVLLIIAIIIIVVNYKDSFQAQQGDVLRCISEESPSGC